jgi:hypothetical protein
MAQGGAGSASLDRREEPTAQRQAGVSEAVDARMNEMQPPGTPATHDRVGRESTGPELLIVEHAPLIGGEFGGRRIRCGVSIWFSAIRTPHLRRVARRPATKQG